MKKSLKITLVSIGSLLAVIMIAIAVIVWYIFNPKRLTPIVNDLLAKNLTCQTDLDEVELTFFSTFPYFEIQINNLVLKQPINGSPSDTLCAVGSLGGRVAPFKYLFDKELVISGLTLNDGFVNIYTDSTGQGNYDIFPKTETKQDTSAFSLPFDFLELQTLDVKRVKITYADAQSGISTNIDNINLSLGATMHQLNGDASVNTTVTGISFVKNDSTPIIASISTFVLRADVNNDASKLTADLISDISGMNFS